MIKRTALNSWIWKHRLIFYDVPGKTGGVVARAFDQGIIFYHSLASWILDTSKYSSCHSRSRSQRSWQLWLCRRVLVMYVSCHKRTLLYLHCCRTGVQNVICKGTNYGSANLISSKPGASIILNGLLGTNKKKTKEWLDLQTCLGLDGHVI